MSRVLRCFTSGALLFAVVLSARPAGAQIPGKVRVVHGPVRIEGWHRNPEREVLFEVGSGTVLEVIGQEEEWYWVITPPDDNRSRRAGWIRQAFVEAVPPALAGSAEHHDSGAAMASDTASSAPEDTVVITERVENAATAATKPAYTFDDVHFERDRYVLRPEDMAALHSAAAALKADPSLSVNIEGHTCSLGTTAYNLGLGLRRATAVKDYLVSEGIAADRLHMLSLGEADAKYDNTAENTRHLNRRVALIPQ